MRPSRTRPAALAAAALVALLALAAAACSSSPERSAATATTLAPGDYGTLADPNVLDEPLAEAFLAVLASEDPAALDEILSPDLILQRADGTHLGKAAYLANPAKVGAFEVTDVIGRRSGDTRVLRYTATVTEAIDGRPVTRDPVPRLSTFVWEDGRWRLVAHANFAALAPDAGR